MKKLIVDKKYNNKKLNTFLLDNFPTLTINTIYKYLRKKDIIVNGSRVNSNVLISNGDEVIIYIPDSLLESNKLDFEIIYEDDNILILNKPIRNWSYWYQFYNFYTKRKLQFFRALS